MPPLKGKHKEARSRHGTPVLSDAIEQPGGQTAGQASPASVSYGDLLDKFCRGSSPPPSATLKKIHEALIICRDVAKERSDKCDKGMRELSRKRKDLIELAHQQELEEAQAEEARKEEQRKAQKKESAEARPLAVGAHGVAKQDGSVAAVDTDVKEEVPPTPEPKSAVSQAHSATSEESHQPRPAPAVPQVQTFGEDPTAFDDPTIYHIREIHDSLPEEDKKEILGVAEYPHDDLHDKTPGTPPDKDFSNAKPSNQVSYQHFANYLEPYVRTLVPEDIAFLEERGDRSGPFVIPRRGQRSYQEIWAEDDGGPIPTSLSRQSLPQPSGSMEQMSDEAAEKGTVSVGPVMSRLLGAMIPERRAPVAENAVNGVNGDAPNGQLPNGDGDVPAETNGEHPGTRPLPPATQMAESTQPGWKTNPPKMEYAAMDQRVLQELRHIGFIDEDAEPDYDGHYDDEVASRLRYLQEELKKISIVNGARKSRVRELAEQAMAKQEYSTISDDLDTQLNQAYLKRHRNIGKGKKIPKRPGAAGGTQIGGIGVSRPGLGEPIKSLMERREEWRDKLGPIVDYGSTELPKETIFDEESMKRHYFNEQELWSEQQE